MPKMSVSHRYHASLTGPDLDEMVKELTEWAVDTRAFLIEALEEGPYPYGSVKLTPAEQLTRYLAMTPVDWESMGQTRLRRYQGYPDAQDRANRDMSIYRERMERLRERISG